MPRVLTALAIALLVACDDGIVGSKTVNGNYTLSTINGVPLPFTVVGTPNSEIVDDVIILYQGFTYAESGHSRSTVNGQPVMVNFTDAGAFALFGTSVTLTSGVTGQQRRGRMDATSMTIVEPGKTSIFRK